MNPDDRVAPGTAAPPAATTPRPAAVPTATNGVNRCVKCGASEVSFDGKWLTCAYCQHRWNTAVLAEELRLSEGIDKLVGTSVLTGANEIDTSSLVTVECSGCGATVTLNTETTLSATCHWCRHVLSLNKPLDNGAVPDAILPFFVTREDAINRMASYIADQGKFASAEFTRDFEHASIQGVYLPYLVVDGTVTVRLEGRAWTRPSGWIAGSGSDTAQTLELVTDESAVMREMDLLVDDLAIEARSTRTKLYAAVSTTNIINAIQPFDVANAVRFNANYIVEGVGFERRDVEVTDAMSEAANLFATIGRGYVNQTLKQYSGGVRWDSEVTAIKGTRWITVLLPVWLHAFEEATPTGPMMHFLAVNGRTGETEGSIPTDEAHARRSGRKWGLGAALAYEVVLGGPGLIFTVVFGAAALTGAIGPLAGVAVILICLALAAPGLVAGKAVAKWRRNMLAQGQRKGAARLKPEFETKYTATRLQQGDRPLGRFTHEGGPEIDGRNDHLPQVRAKNSRVVFGDLPAPPATESATANTAWDAQQLTQPDARGRRRAGQQYSAVPLGTDPARVKQLIPGWRDS